MEIEFKEIRTPLYGLIVVVLLGLLVWGSRNLHYQSEEITSHDTIVIHHTLYNYLYDNIIKGRNLYVILAILFSAAMINSYLSRYMSKRKLNIQLKEKRM